MTTTLSLPNRLALDEVAEAYRACRTALHGLRQPWADLRDPAKPWQQNLLLLHDQHQILLRAADTVQRSLNTASEFYADQRERDYHERDRSLVEHLEHHPDLVDGLRAVGLHPEQPTYSLEQFAPHHLVENYPNDNRVAAHANALIEAQRAYLHTALNPR